MADRIYVLLDHGDGRPNHTSLESLVLGQKLSRETGNSLHAVILGHNLGSIAESIAGYALEEVVTVEDPLLAQDSPEGCCAALAQILKQDRPRLLLMGHLYRNIDLAPKLAAHLNSALVTDCIDYKMTGGELLFVRQMFRSKLNADIKINAEHPWIVTVQSGACSLDDLGKGSAQISKRAVELGATAFRRKALETLQMTPKKVDLAQADVVIGAGRGIKTQEDMAVVQELADVLGAEIGASRPIVDNEWLERDRQIGSSGQTVSPKLYIAVGISGAIQHVVGIRNSGCIVAINSDPNAPIFNVATYGIVGDLMEIVPVLTQRLREQRHL
jgi:electron transfer flavoprotein alpha subunit